MLGVNLLKELGQLGLQDFPEEVLHKLITRLLKLYLLKELLCK